MACPWSSACVTYTVGPVIATDELQEQLYGSHSCIERIVGQALQFRARMRIPKACPVLVSYTKRTANVLKDGKGGGRLAGPPLVVPQSRPRLRFPKVPTL